MMLIYVFIVISILIGIKKYVELVQLELHLLTINVFDFILSIELFIVILYLAKLLNKKFFIYFMNL